MRYSQIRKMDISNGEGIGVSLFVQGCPLRCSGCFNQATWDFNGGKEWTKQTEEEFLLLAGKPYVKRISILGGEPLCSQNYHKVFELCRTLKKLYPNKKVWIYSGYTYEELLTTRYQFEPLLFADVLVDGRFQEELKDMSLSFCGSKNQRVIDVPETIRRHEITLYME